MMKRLMGGAVVAEYSKGSGEALEREARRRRYIVLGSLFVLGVGLGAFIGDRHEEMPLMSGAADWPPALALTAAGLYLGAMIISSMLLGRWTDEVQRQAQYKATAIAAAVYFLGYPVWFLLWKGGLVREPMHELIFAASWVALALSSIYYRFR
jgi:ABC-type sulfate transport system permease component